VYYVVVGGYVRHLRIYFVSPNILNASSITINLDSIVQPTPCFGKTGKRTPFSNSLEDNGSKHYFILFKTLYLKHVMSKNLK